MNLQFSTNKSYTPGSRKRTLNREFKVGPVSVRVLTIAALASLLLFYLAQITQGATKSYELNSLELQKEELQNEVERLELEAVRLQSLNEIQKFMDEKKDDFEPIDSVDNL